MEYYIVDAFTDEIFKGNPAGVCVLEHEMPKEWMQNIAAENNLPETAFVYGKEGNYQLRWFTPGFEIDLCGHATLAAAFVITNFVEPKREEIAFETMSGIRKVVKKGDLYEMSFPKRMPQKIALTDEMTEALGIKPLEVYSERDLYFVLQNEQQVKEIVPDYEKLEKLNQWLGIVVTAQGTEADFVSRYFCPELMAEDPVTGSSHSSLIPLWQEKTGKTKFKATQLSKRGGTLYCEAGTDEVKISGKAVLYLRGEIMNTYFPLFMNLKEREVLIFGGGTIAQRRVKALLSYGAHIHLIAPEISEELQELAKENNNLVLEYRKYKLSELQKPDFVLAATNDERVNATIYRECRHKGIMVNVASDKELCDFYFPGIVTQGDITVGITANGKNHKKAAEVTEKIKHMLEEEEP